MTKKKLLILNVNLLYKRSTTTAATTTTTIKMGQQNTPQNATIRMPTNVTHAPQRPEQTPATRYVSLFSYMLNISNTTVQIKFGIQKPFLNFILPSLIDKLLEEWKQSGQD